MEKKLCLLFLVVNIHLTSSASHCLRYVHTAVTSGVNYTEISTVGLVDGEQTTYDDIKKKIPNANKETEIIEDHQEMLRSNVFVMKDFRRFGNLRQTEGVHTVQVMCGCELDDDGTERGHSQFCFDGEDVLSLDLNTVTWTAASPRAFFFKHKLKHDHWADLVKDYLMYDCIDWLKKFIKYGRETLERKVPPEVYLFQMDSSSPVVCHATGFFPKSVMISWQKNGEDLEEDVKIRETLPNQDGTFQKRSILTVSPEELNKHDYTCIIQHSSLDKEMVLQVSDRRVLSASHSLRYVHTAVISGVNYTEISTVGLVDGEQTTYDDIKKKIPNANEVTEIIEDHQEMLRRDVFVMKDFRQTEDGSLYRILLIVVAAALLIFSLCVVVKECEMKQRGER